MAKIIQTPSHLCKYFVAVELEYNDAVIPSTGYETHYDEMIAWCSQNISKKWYSGRMQQPNRSSVFGNPNARSIFGTEDIVGVAIFNFEDYDDKAHFILKWL